VARPASGAGESVSPGQESVDYVLAPDQQPAQFLAGTQALNETDDLLGRMLAGLDVYLTRQLAASVSARRRLWSPDGSSDEAYLNSVANNRERFRRIIGAVDARVPSTVPRPVGSVADRRLLARGGGYTVQAVRWAVLDGVDAEGLLLQPDAEPVARVVAIPDADVSPEQAAGLAPGLPVENQFARRLAENGCQVFVPVLIDRQDTFSGNPQIRFTNQPHREYVYRAAFSMGRHIIGYEVQKVLAAVDRFVADAATDPRIAVVGHGEGGLLALYAAAIDTRIDTTVVSGYFQEREGVWAEPLYRNVWSLLREFGDAELAALIAPRVLIIEAARGPKVDGPPPARDRRDGAAPGRLVSPPLDSVRREVERARPVFTKLGVAENLQFIVSGDGHGSPFCESSLLAVLRSVGPPTPLRPSRTAPQIESGTPNPQARLRRQFDQLIEHAQRLMNASEAACDRFWSRADTSSLDRFVATSKWYRDYLHDEVFGRLPPPTVPARPRTRLVYNEPTWYGYEVLLDVYPDVIANGVLLVPKNLRRGERRPVVVCQHGTGGSAHDTIRRDSREFGFYQAFAARLVDRGFVVYAPQNPYGFVGKFQALQRKANPLKLSHFSFITRQHERTLDWLVTQPFVDESRIGFYGLSFGGKTAMRVPPLLTERYALSICSADFTDWIRKTSSTTDHYSYMFTEGWSIYEFDLASTFNYAELAWLMIPRPFMVERGRQDPVGPDEWVAREYDRVRRQYEKLGIGERTEIEYFDGPHTIHGVGTFEFLHRQLEWPPSR